MLAISVLAGCGGKPAGETTCREFTRLSAAQRAELVREMDPKATQGEQQFSQKFLYDSCSNPKVTDPSGQIGGIHP